MKSILRTPIPWLLLVAVLTAISFQNCSSSLDVKSPPPQEAQHEQTEEACKTLHCQAGKFNLFVADIDGSNVQLIKKSSYQDMTHPRVSADKQWIVYTTYNNRDNDNCGTMKLGFENSELRAIRFNGQDDKSVVAPEAGVFNTNAYFLGTTNTFSYLSGPASGLKLMRQTVDAGMNKLGGPTQIPVPSSILPLDPAPHLATNKIVFPGVFFHPSYGGYIKSLFLMNYSDGTGLIGLTLGRDHTNGLIVCRSPSCDDIMENDPKISPDGSKVAFMRNAAKSGANGFGWHLFVVNVSNPYAEVDISYKHLGANILLNDSLPEWVNNDLLIFSHIEVKTETEMKRFIYVTTPTGGQRTKLPLPEGFLYADVFPFKDSSGKQKIVVSAEKIGTPCD